MRCEPFRDLAWLAIDGELDAKDQAALEHHLQGCPDCRAAVAAARAMSGGLRRLPVEPMPAGLALRTLDPASTARRRTRVLLAWAAPLLAAAALVVLASLHWLDGEGELGAIAGRARVAEPAPLAAAIERDVARASSPAAAMARLLAVQGRVAAVDRDERSRALDHAGAASRPPAHEAVDPQVQWIVVDAGADSLQDWLELHPGHAREGDLIVVDLAPAALAELRERLAARAIDVRDGSAADFVPPRPSADSGRGHSVHLEDVAAGEAAGEGEKPEQDALRSLGYLGADDEEGRPMRVVIRLERRPE